MDEKKGLDKIGRYETGAINWKALDNKTSNGIIGIK